MVIINASAIHSSGVQDCIVSLPPKTSMETSKQMPLLLSQEPAVPASMCLCGFRSVEEFHKGVDSDVCDGMIARNFRNQQSMLGSFLDPMADKVLVAVLFLSLTYKDLIPLPLTTLIIARDICLMSAGFYIRYRSLPPPVRP
ncbi:unnamed protein product [Darwinula stevensoni]|uniref:cardiolipin synthase (CMP-forming) n=1 Tax=Darwinula stevensoni TaxID=69355 RepID=A0A7R8XFB8_9CRUS|nr:unnamed protein product [Darwinula stevensoni]CAG0896113.1 unnamed protein product [Darwinula stevensoni]